MFRVDLETVTLEKIDQQKEFGGAFFTILQCFDQCVSSNHASLPIDHINACQEKDCRKK